MLATGFKAERQLHATPGSHFLHMRQRFVGGRLGTYPGVLRAREERQLLEFCGI